LPPVPRALVRRRRADAQARRLIIIRPQTIDEALAARAANPAAVVVAGGTGVLLELNRGNAPHALIDLSRIAGWRGAERAGDALRLAAGVTYTQVLEDLAGPLPGLALAARTVASRQIRNRGTLAGALVLADPSGDALAALGAAGADVELRGPEGPRHVPAETFVTAPGVSVLRADELVVALRVPVADGPVAYAKAGARNAMARAVCAVAVALHETSRTASVCVVGAAPTAVRPAEAEALVAGAGDALDEAVLRDFGELAAAAVDPSGDARASAPHRRHAVAVLARRALRRAWGERV
jgi:CO/xanthine dehydrogenase FAD-binding subunit